MREWTFGPYQIKSLIGRGGMGEVYRAFDTVHDRMVALKLLAAHLSTDDNYRARFRRECHLAARLREPHVIPIHSYGEHDGRLFLDMRLVEGRDLATVLADDGKLDPARAVNIIGQVARALDAAHHDGLIHRDVKPSNVILDEGDEDDDDFLFAYLVDFGVARAVGDDAKSAALTSTGGAVGTFDYMPPERFTGSQADRHADVYSLACMLYESLTGMRPFGTGQELAALMFAHMNTAPPKASAHADVNSLMDDVIARGMAKDPAARYASASALASAARSALLGPGRRDRPAGGHGPMTAPTAATSFPHRPATSQERITPPPTGPATPLPPPSTAPNAARTGAPDRTPPPPNYTPPPPNYTPPPTGAGRPTTGATPPGTSTPSGYPNQLVTPPGPPPVRPYRPGPAPHTPPPPPITGPFPPAGSGGHGGSRGPGRRNLLLGVAAVAAVAVLVLVLVVALGGKKNNPNGASSPPISTGFPSTGFPSTGGVSTDPSALDSQLVQLLPSTITESSCTVLDASNTHATAGITCQGSTDKSNGPTTTRFYRYLDVATLKADLEAIFRANSLKKATQACPGVGYRNWNQRSNPDDVRGQMASYFNYGNQYATITWDDEETLLLAIAQSPDRARLSGLCTWWTKP